LNSVVLRSPAALNDLKPPRWLRSRHVQSMLASTAWRRARVLAAARPLLGATRELLLECGEGVRLQCFLSPSPGAGTPVVLLHGWEGSADSVYMLSLAQLLHERGFEVARLNLRDHGETHHLNRELFHSCRLAEVVGAIGALQRQHFNGRAAALVGFSLGGNFMLRVAAQARAAQLSLSQVIAVSPVLDPAATLAALQRAFPGYELYFVRKWRRSLARKQVAWPDAYDFTAIRRMRDLRTMTAELVRAYTDFPALEDYLNGYAITGTRLARLEVPSSIITSADDPIIPVAGLERLARPGALTVTVSRYGGHCGFFEGLAGPSWLERRILTQLGSASP
jgi:uncharacterized protein